MSMAQVAMRSASFNKGEDSYSVTKTVFDESTSPNTDIQIRAKQLAGENILLAYYYFGQVYVKDSLELDAKGKGTFKSKEKYPQGLYAICVKRAPVIDLILGDDQSMTVKIDTTNHYDKVSVEGSLESLEFNNYALFMKQLQRTSREKEALIKTPHQT